MAARAIGRCPASVICLGALCVAARAQSRLEYHFQAGDHLMYERRTVVSVLSTGQTVQQIVDAIQLWCLETTGDEALLLLEYSRTASGRVEPARGVLFHVDRQGRARIPQPSQTHVPELELTTELLPVQRLALQQGESGWRTPPDVFGRRRRCTLIGPEGERAGQPRVDFTIEHAPACADVLGHSDSGRYWFDPRAGVVTRVESLHHERLADRSTQALTVLRRHTRRPASWTRRRAAEAAVYLQTLEHEDRLIDAAVQQPERIAQTVERLGRLWSGQATVFDARAGSPFGRLSHARQARLPADTTDLRAGARYAARWLNASAPRWSLQDAAGNTVTSEQLRHGAVIECLWSTESPHFVATLAALRALQPQLAGKPIRIICLNLDTDTHLAVRAIEALTPGLTHVLAGPLRAVDDPPRLPLVRVLDRDGVVRRLWLGWRPTYTDALAEALRWAE